MGTNIPRPTRRPRTPAISDQPYGSKTNEAIIKAFDQFHKVAHDLTYHDTDLDQTIKERRTNCPNCCAVITGPICEYCGTRFDGGRYSVLRTTEGEEIVIPIYIGNEHLTDVIRKHDPTFRSGGV